MKVVVFLLAVSLMQLVFGQAPGDFQEICRTSFLYRPFHDWIPYVNDTTNGGRTPGVKWQILVDQYDYQTILETVWTRRDVDGDGRQIDPTNTICTNSLRIRDTYLNPNSSNWVFTQAVSYLDAVEVIVNATVRFRGCRQRSSFTPPCNNNFVILHCYDTNSIRPSNEQTNIDNYEPCFGDAMSSRLENSSSINNPMIVIKKFARPSNFNMTYFGIQDIGSYGEVQRILVYYRVAQGYEEGLVRCPTIALPREGSNHTVSKNCTCKKNAMPTNNNMQLTCRGNGVCEGSPMCQCRAGYQGQSDCQACPGGTYRSIDLTSCVPCPQNSTSGMAASKCSCIEGTYRAKLETVHDNCTTPPSEPQSPTHESTNVTYTIRWVAPSDNGGRNDTFYNITYADECSISGISKSITTTNTSYVISNLKPATTYQIGITAENGVSDNEVSFCQLHQRTVTVTCTTKEGVPEKPFGVEVVDNLLIWQEPDTTNGVITGYDVHITFTPEHDPITRNLDSSKFYFNFRQEEIPEDATAHVQVRANTVSHNGKWSDVISFTPHFGADVTCPPPPTTCPSPPVCTTVTPEPPPDVTCPTPTEDVTNPLVFKLGGKTYTNNTAVKVEDIGEGVNALLCVSNNTHCCVRSSSFRGEFYYPNGVMVPVKAKGHAVYRNREANFIRLNRRVIPSSLGRYRCDILDDAGVVQTLYINID